MESKLRVGQFKSVFFSVEGEGGAAAKKGKITYAFTYGEIGSLDQLNHFYICCFIINLLLQYTYTIKLH